MNTTRGTIGLPYGMPALIASPRFWVAVILFLVTIFAAARFPFPAGWVLSGLLALAALQWRLPQTWLYACPVILAGINLAPWTGWMSFGVIDMFLCTTLGVELLRRPPETVPRFRRFSVLLLGLFGASMAVSATLALLPFTPPTVNSFFDYLDPYNALRILRGMVLALIAIWLARRAIAQNLDAPAHFLRGVAMAVVVVAAAAIYERIVYADIFPFLRAYRVVGTFASMHVGGSHIGAFLVLGLAPSFMLMLKDRSIAARALGAAAFLTGGITLLLTFSRAAWLGTGCSLLVLATLFALTHQVRRLRTVIIERLAVVGIAGMLIYVTAIVGQAGFLQQRLENIPTDFRYRLELSSDAIGMMDKGWQPRLLGMGLGSFPRLYYSRNTHGVHAARRGIVTENGNRFLRSVGGKNGEGVAGEMLFNVGQRIRLEPNRTYRLSFRAKSPTRTGLRIEIKERHILNHRYGIAIGLPRSFTDDWRSYEATFNSEFLGKGSPLTRRAHSFIIFNRSVDSIVDIDDIRLEDGNGRNLLRNGDFTDGHDHWIFEAPNHVAYQVKNGFVGVYVEQGLFGLISFLALFLFAVLTFRRTQVQIASLSALVGFAAFTVFDNALVSPRLLMFFLVYWAIVCMLPAGPSESTERTQ